MSEHWIIFAIGGVFALFLGRSAIIAIWPDSDAARFCEFQLGFLDHVDTGDGDDGDCGGGAGGGDGGGGD
jgi:hypothetical protein